ncbi:hypothetical protein PM082_010912 [Marasmius tenuissimus]|nr:hypothetical protein PM082_010912 [Marasmius tenuissimus]
MLKNPESQKKCQQKITEVIGNDRLPDFSDMGTIPYVDAIMQETLRWNPVTPLAMPHRVIEDDEYRGYHIPAGAVVFGNSWAILHDESLYGPDTHLFDPERFITAEGTLNFDVPHPTMAFGFGRRQCPGLEQAESTLWLTIASILCCFNIAKHIDEEGVVDEPSCKYTSGMLCYPLPFKCSIRPRSPLAESLIKGANDIY